MSEFQSEQVDRLAVRRRAAAQTPTTDNDGPPHEVLRLQQQVGNAQVGRMLAQRASPEDEEAMQAKRDPALQRASPEDEEEPLQAKAEVGAEGGAVSPLMAGKIQAMRGGGAPLDDATRSNMERTFDTSFEDVRLHTGAEAAEASRGLGALAFTTGNDVFLRDDAYQPGTDSGGRLLGHELAHVVQQRSMSSTEGMQVGPANDSYEQAADAVADHVVSQPQAAPQRKTEQE